MENKKIPLSSEALSKFVKSHEESWLTPMKDEDMMGEITEGNLKSSPKIKIDLSQGARG